MIHQHMTYLSWDLAPAPVLQQLQLLQPTSSSAAAVAAAPVQTAWWRVVQGMLWSSWWLPVLPFVDGSAAHADDGAVVLPAAMGCTAAGHRRQMVLAGVQLHWQWGVMCSHQGMFPGSLAPVMYGEQQQISKAYVRDARMHIGC